MTGNGPLTNETLIEMRGTVAVLRVQAECNMLLLMGLLPLLTDAQKTAMGDRLDRIETAPLDSGNLMPKADLQSVRRQWVASMMGAMHGPPPGA